MHSAKDIECRYERILRRERLVELSRNSSNRWADDEEGLRQEAPRKPHYDSERYRDDIEAEYLSIKDQADRLEDQLESQIFSAEVAPGKREELEELKAQCAQYEKVSFLQRADERKRITDTKVDELSNAHPTSSAFPKVPENSEAWEVKLGEKVDGWFKELKQMQAFAKRTGTRTEHALKKQFPAPNFCIWESIDNAPNNAQNLSEPARKSFFESLSAAERMELFEFIGRLLNTNSGPASPHTVESWWKAYRNASGTSRRRRKNPTP